MGFEITKEKYLIITFLIVLFFVFLNYSKYYNDKFVEGDGFVYLSYSKSVFTGSRVFLDNIRSPLIAFLILPYLEIARIAIIFYHITNSILIFLIINKLTKNNISSLFGSICYGTSPYLIDFIRKTMIDLPAIMFFLISFYFFISPKKKDTILSGTFAGISFIIRPDISLLLLPMILFNIKNKNIWMYFIPPFLFFSIIVNLLSASIVFRELTYPPLNFVLVNFFTEKMAFNTQATEYHNYFWFIKNFIYFNIAIIPFLLLSIFNIKNKKFLIIFIMFIFISIISLFLPKIDYRIYITKATPIASILASSYILLFQKREKTIYIPIVLSFILLIGTNFLIVNNFRYPEWRIDKVNYKTDGIICSNMNVINIYYTNKPAISLLYFDKPVESRLNLTELNENINYIGCDYIYVFHHNQIYVNREEIDFLYDKFSTNIIDVGDYDVYEFKLTV